MSAVQFERSDEDGTELLSVCRLDGNLVIQVEAGALADADRALVGLYDLDGDQLALANHDSWELVDDAELTAAQIEEIACSWESGTSVVRRVGAQS